MMNISTAAYRRNRPASHPAGSRRAAEEDSLPAVEVFSGSAPSKASRLVMS